MYSALLKELKKKGKIKQGNIEFYTVDGGLRVSDGNNTHDIKDNNTLVSLSNKNHKVSKAVDIALGGYF